MLDLTKDLFCGCMSGWAQVLSMMPFENIKIKMVSKPTEYTGYYMTVLKTIKE